MSDLYSIVKQFNDSLVFNLDKLLYTDKINFLYQYERLNKKVECEFNLFLKNKLNSEIILDNFTWGLVLNLDMLADFLLQSIYTKLPDGNYKQDENEFNKVKAYQRVKMNNIYDTFIKLFNINLCINQFITFVRENYDFNFFNKINIYEQEDIRNFQFDMYHACTKLLKARNYCYSEDLKTAKNVFEVLKEEEVYKEDLLSFFIDSGNYSNVCILEYNILLDDINNFLNLTITKKPRKEITEFELNVYIKFANDLKEFIEDRMKSLSCSVLKK